MAARTKIAAHQPHLERIQRLWLQRLQTQTPKTPLQATDYTDCAPQIHSQTLNTSIHVLGVVPHSLYGLGLIRETYRHFRPHRLAVWYAPKQAESYRDVLQSAYKQHGGVTAWTTFGIRKWAIQNQSRLVKAFSMDHIMPTLLWGLPCMADLALFDEYQARASAAANNNKTKMNPTVSSDLIIPLKPTSTSTSPSLAQSVGVWMDGMLANTLQTQLQRQKLLFDHRNRGIQLNLRAAEMSKDPKVMQWAELFQRRFIALSPSEVHATAGHLRVWQRWQSSVQQRQIRQAAATLIKALEPSTTKETQRVVAVVPFPFVLELEQELLRQMK